MSVVWEVTKSSSAPQIAYDEYEKWKAQYVEFLKLEDELNHLLTDEERNEFSEVLTNHSMTLGGFKEVDLKRKLRNILHNVLNQVREVLGPLIMAHFVVEFQAEQTDQEVALSLLMKN